MTPLSWYHHDMVLASSTGMRLVTVLVLATVGAAQVKAKARKALQARSLALAKLWGDETDRSVSKGLEWLAKNQLPRGQWIGDTGHKRGDGYIVYNSAAMQKANRQGNIGVTALAGMAFLSGGHLPDRGKYGKVVKKAVDYILGRVTASGLIQDARSRMYGHAFATLFLAEVYGMSREKEIKKGLEKAVHIIVDCQNEHGAWRYNPFSKAADLSVTVCQLQALRAARNIGIEVPRTTVQKAVAYVKASQTQGGSDAGLFYYKIHGTGSYRKNTQFSINAAGLTALTSAGIYDRELMGPAVRFLLEEWQNVRDWGPNHYYFWYGNYYTCQALFHADGVVRESCFRDYYAGMQKHLLADQETDGRWRNTLGPGDV